MLLAACEGEACQKAEIPSDVSSALPDALDHCVAGHVSAEPAHRRLLAELGLTPVLDLGMRLGEGSGAAMAAGIVKAAVDLHNGMATFQSAGVANKDV